MEIINNTDSIVEDYLRAWTKYQSDILDLTEIGYDPIKATYLVQQHHPQFICN